MSDAAALEKAVATTRSVKQEGKTNDFSCAVERFAVDNASAKRRVGFRPEDLKFSNPLYLKFLEEIKLNKKNTKAVKALEKLLLGQGSQKGAKAEAVCDPLTLICLYGSFSQQLPPSIFFSLTGMGNDEEVCKALMRMAALNPGGQQLSMPFAWFAAVEKNLGLSLIGYASVLNRYPGVPYCSIFEEDKQFGSLGSYYDLDLKAFLETQGNHVVVTQNPPFTELSLAKAAQRAEEIIATAVGLGKDATVITTGPAWENAVFFKQLSVSKWLKKPFFVAKFQHYYENPGEPDPAKTKVLARANSQLFVLSTRDANYQFLYDVFTDLTGVK